jgi:hypothetical protein
MLVIFALFVLLIRSRESAPTGGPRRVGFGERLTMDRRKRRTGTRPLARRAGLVPPDTPAGDRYGATRVELGSRRRRDAPSYGLSAGRRWGKVWA